MLPTTMSALRSPFTSPRASVGCRGAPSSRVRRSNTPFLTCSSQAIDASRATLGALGNGSTNPNGLAYNTTDHRLYMVDNSADNLYTINLTTGAAELVGSTGSGNLLGLAFIPDIPEPSSLALAGIAVAAALVRRR